MTEQEMRRREEDNLENGHPGRRETDKKENAQFGRRKTDHAGDTRHGRRKTDHLSNTKAVYGIRSFFEAFGIIFLAIAIVVLAVSLYERPVQVQVTPIVAMPVLPADVPMIPGAMLTRYIVNGKTTIFNYTVPQSTKASVQGYFKTELEKRDWVRQPRSAEAESEYKKENRKIIVTARYQGTQVLLQITITG